MTIMLNLGNTTKLIKKKKCHSQAFEELESENIAISTDGDRIFDLVREGNFMYT